MTSPQHLHALAAAWSLTSARERLADLARQEAHRNTTTLLDAAHLLRSGVMGVRHGVGGHGDPTGTLLAARPMRETTWAELLQRSDDRLRWLADQIRQPDTGVDPLARILARLSWLQPGTARVVAQHLQDEDRWVRDAIRQPRPVQPLPGVACPHCGQRQLVVQTAGPVDVWTVVCATGRVCLGQGCRCGMPGAVEGVAHIWPRHVVLGAVAGAAPNQPN